MPNSLMGRDASPRVQRQDPETSARPLRFKILFLPIPSNTNSIHPPLLQSRMFYRSDNRTPDQMRPVNIIPGFINTAEGSVLIEVGNTRVICTASIEETVPPFMRNSGKG